MSNTSRRAVLAGLSSFSVAASAAAASASLAGAAPADLSAVDRLWLAYLQNTREKWEINRRVDELTAQLPWWVRPGPKYIAAEGYSTLDETSHHPAIQWMEPPRPGAFRMIRPGPDDIERDLRHVVGIFGSTPQSVEAHQKRLSEYEARVAEAEALTDAVGLTALDDASEALCTRNLEIQDELEALPFSFDRMAALVLIRAVSNASADELFNDDWAPERFVVADLRPMLRGAVAETVANMLDNPERPFGKSPLWDYPWPRPGEDELHDTCSIAAIGRFQAADAALAQAKREQDAIPPSRQGMPGSRPPQLAQAG